MADHSSTGDATKPKGLAALAHELKDLRDTLRLGGGGRKIQRQHDQGKLTARERIRLLTDEGSTWVEIGLLVAHDRYDGAAPGAGVVTGGGGGEGR